MPTFGSFRSRAKGTSAVLVSHDAVKRNSSVGVIVLFQIRRAFGHIYLISSPELSCAVSLSPVAAGMDQSQSLSGGLNRHSSLCERHCSRAYSTYVGQ